MDLVCFRCQKTNNVGDKVHFRDECEFCSQDLHSCKQCQHYDVKSYNECKESSADRVLDKDKANYCDYFTAKTSSSGNQESDKREDLLAQAEALFKKN